MTRTSRARMAEETVAICEAGYFTAPSGAHASIREQLDRAKAATVLYSPEKQPAQKTAARKLNTRFEVYNETTFSALVRMSATGSGHLACLNFASAKNPGGGFLNGSQAQEEALARASGLYPCLLTAREYYERNRANGSALYLDMAIFSPHVPFFRDDSGVLLEKPILASVITAPAPNAGAVEQNERNILPKVAQTLKRRAELVLSIALAHEVERLVLGAWGCGVFRNDPHVVAKTFAEFLKPPGRFAGAFAEVVFAVFDRSEGSGTYRAFAEVFKA